jgi:hypothetical protein
MNGSLSRRVTAHNVPNDSDLDIIGSKAHDTISGHWPLLAKLLQHTRKGAARWIEVVVNIQYNALVPLLPNGAVVRST